MLSAKKRSLMPRHFVPFGYFPDSSHCGRGVCGGTSGRWRRRGGCQCREAPFKKCVVAPPSSIFASFHSAAYRGSSLLLLLRFRCLLFSIIVKQQPKHGTFHNLKKSFLKKHSSCFYVFARYLILDTKMIKIKEISRENVGCITVKTILGKFVNPIVALEHDERRRVLNLRAIMSCRHLTRKISSVRYSFTALCRPRS